MIDWVGIILSVGAMACLVMGIDFGGIQWSWGSGSSIALFVVAGVLFIAFAIQQTFLIFCTLETRLFPIHFLKRRSFVVLFALNSESFSGNLRFAGLTGTGCASSGLFISVYYIPLFFQFTKVRKALLPDFYSIYLMAPKGDTAVHASVRLLPFVLVLIFVIVLNGHMMIKLGYYLPWYLVGGAIELIGATLMCKYCYGH